MRRRRRVELVASSLSTRMMPIRPLARTLLRSMLLVDDILLTMEQLLLLLPCAALPMPARRARSSRAHPRSC